MAGAKMAKPLKNFGINVTKNIISLGFAAAFIDMGLGLCYTFSC